MLLYKNGKNKKKKGVALIFALFTIVVLCAISTTVTAVAVNNSRDVKRFNADELVLQAANWGIEAAINYMGMGDECESGRKGCALSQNSTHIKVDSLTSLDYFDFGLSIGEDIPAARLGTVELLTFRDSDGSKESGSSYSGDKHGKPYLLNKYGDAGHGFLVGVIKAERTYDKGQPSVYYLYSIAKMDVDDYGDKGANLKPGAFTDHTTRVVKAKVREETASDFMHFVENARSWDANGVDLSQNGVVSFGSNGRQYIDLAHSAVLLPQGYKENGKLYVSGHNVDTDDAAKRNMCQEYHDKVLKDGKQGWDGRLGFFSEGNNDFKSSNYTFGGDVTTRYGNDKYGRRIRNQISYDTKPAKDTVEGMMGGNWNTGSSSGYKMPEEKTSWKDSSGHNKTGTFFDKVNYEIKKDVPDGKHAIHINVGGNLKSESVFTANTIGTSSEGKSKYPDKNTCPDIAQSVTKSVDSNGNIVMVNSSTPTFSTIRIEIKGDECRILKYNSALSNLKRNNDGSPYKVMAADGSYEYKYENNGSYVEDLTSKYFNTSGYGSVSAINKGVISVTGGNVEVVNVTKFGQGNAFGTEIKKGDQNDIKGYALKGELSILADVNGSRNDSLDKKSDYTSSADSVYSKAARDLTNWINTVKGSASNYDLAEGTYVDSDGSTKKRAGTLLQEFLNNEGLQPPYSSSSLKDAVKAVKKITNQSVTDHQQLDGTQYNNNGRRPKVISEGLLGTDASSYSASDVSTRSLWPIPANRALEREGNIIVGSDLRSQGENSMLGLISKNFIYLNDRNMSKKSTSAGNLNGVESGGRKNELKIDGVLMSYDHSVQFDWNNLTGNKNWNQDTVGYDPSQKKITGTPRTITLKGAIISAFLDAEGDTYGRGYYKQNFEHDARLRNQLPPYMPPFSKDNEEVSIQYIVLSYEDMGALK